MKLLWSEEGWEDYLHWQETDRGTDCRRDDHVDDPRAHYYARDLLFDEETSPSAWHPARIASERMKFKE